MSSSSKATLWDTCALCPRLCRVSCPVATGSAREAAVPSLIAAVLRDWVLGRASPDEAREAATLCTDCGACQERCHLHLPLPKQLRQVREELGWPAQTGAVGSLSQGAWVMVEVDERPAAAALSRALGEPVVGLRWRGTPALLPDLAQELVGRTVVVAHGGVAQVLTKAGVSVRWLHEVVEGVGGGAPLAGSCVCRGETPLACCGGAGPLQDAHPDDANRVAALWSERSETEGCRDTRCASHLQRHGLPSRDAVDALLALHP